MGIPAYMIFEKSFRKVAIHDPKKAKKLAISNAKLSADEREEPKIMDVWLTEKSLTEKFADLFGYKCDIIAKMLYIKASKCLDYSKLTIVDFYNMFSPLVVSLITRFNFY
jgi:hypothetical protein